MRGKYATRATNRAAIKEQSESERLTLELAQQKETSTRLQRQLVEQDALKAEIARLRDLNEQNTSDSLDKMSEMYSALLDRVKKLNDWRDHIQRLWDKVGMQIMDREGLKGMRGFEELGRIIGAWDGHTTIMEFDLQQGLGSEAIKRIRRARELRRPVV